MKNRNIMVYDWDINKYLFVTKFEGKVIKSQMFEWLQKSSEHFKHNFTKEQFCTLLKDKEIRINNYQLTIC